MLCLDPQPRDTADDLSTAAVSNGYALKIFALRHRFAA